MRNNSPPSTPVLLSFPSGMVVGRFLRREKRFFMAVCIKNAEGVEIETWAHTNNTGTMLGLIRPGTPVLLSPAQNEKRALRWTAEALWHGGVYSHEAELPAGRTPFVGNNGFWVGVNTSIPNKLLEAAFYAGLLPFAEGYSSIRREAVRGKSRLDGLFEGPGLPRLWVECKNVTLVEDGVALFPDAVSVRAVKHLDELEAIVRAGERAVMVYVVQRPDGGCFGPAEVVDAVYARRFYEVCCGDHGTGVEVYVVVCEVSTAGYMIGRRLPLRSF